MVQQKEEELSGQIRGQTQCRYSTPLVERDNVKALRMYQVARRAAVFSENNYRS